MKLVKSTINSFINLNEEESKKLRIISNNKKVFKKIGKQLNEVTGMISFSFEIHKKTMEFYTDFLSYECQFKTMEKTNKEIKSILKYFLK